MGGKKAKKGVNLLLVVIPNCGVRFEKKKKKKKKS